MFYNILALIFVSAGFGFAFVLIKFAEQTIPPLTLQSSRATIGFFSLLVISLMLGKDIRGHARHWFAFLIFAVLGIAYLWIVTGLGEEYISAGLTSVLVSVTPMVTFMITVFITRTEKFSLTGLTGLIIGVVGLIVLIGIDNILSGGSTLAGVLLIVSGFAVFAVNGVLAPRLATGTDPVVATTYYTGIAIVIMWVVAFIYEKPLQSSLNTESLLAEIVMGVFCFAAAFVVYYWLLGRAGAFFSSLIFYFVPIMGVLGSFIILGEKITYSQILGMIVVFLGVYLINRKKIKGD